jgi:DNA-binding Lrp family transcriptional regulator
VITAIVLIRAVQGSVPALAQELLDIPEVAEVYSVAGEYDLVAILRVKEYSDMAEVVPGKLQRLSGVDRTETMMAFQCYSRHDLERLFSIGLEDESPVET